jgi:ATP-dependent protease ClpP protease subunit
MLQVTMQITAFLFCRAAFVLNSLPVFLQPVAQMQGQATDIDNQRKEVRRTKNQLVSEDEEQMILSVQW